METTMPDNQNGPIVQQEDAERIPTENPMDGQGNQVLDGEADQHLLQSNVGGVSLGSHVPLPVMIAVQNGNGRNDMINPSMSNMMPQTLRYTNFPHNIIQQYPYANNSTLTYNGDLSNGAGSISLAPVTPSINVNQSSSVPLTGSIPQFNNSDIRIQSIEDPQRVLSSYYFPNYLKQAEDILLANCLTSIDADGFQVSQQDMIHLLGDIMNDNERGAIAKDENQLHQVLQIFLQQHSDLAVKNVVYSDDYDVSKKQLDYSSLFRLYAQFNNSDMILDKDGKAIPDNSWLQQPLYTTPPRRSDLNSIKNKNTRPGKPTVLTADEEAILADFILRLEEKSIRLPREDVGKLVLGILSTLNRSHPFKDDGPHRHWFNGFFKRNPNIMRTRQNSNSIPREPLKDEQINQFLSEIKRLEMNGLLHYAAHHLHLSCLDENGYHINIPQETPPTSLPSFMPPPSVPPPVTPLPVDPNDKKFHKSWTSDQLKWAVDEVSNGRSTVKDASDRSGIPVATIRNHCRNPQMGARRGPPTVLTATEELALEKFLIKLDDCGYKANKEELGKIVMEIVNSDKRPHPFKEDGPHRHWFDVGYYRRHKALLARKKASNSSLSRQEAPPDLMKQFFAELNELKIQNGEIIEPRHKRQKITNEVNLLGTDTATINYEIPPPIDNTGIPQPPTELITQINQTQPLPVTQAVPLAGSVPPTEMFNEVSNKKGGRPKLRLFSVRPNRQKMRVARIMDYIRGFAVQNQENVDDILWSLLMLRVRGSGNTEIFNELEKLYQMWERFITNNEAPADIPPVQPVPMQPTLSHPPAPGNQIAVELGPLPQPMQSAEAEYSIHGLPMDNPNILENVQPDLITRV